MRVGLLHLTENLHGQSRESLLPFRLNCTDAKDATGMGSTASGERVERKFPLTKLRECGKSFQLKRGEDTSSWY